MPILRYVDTASTAGGDGTTSATSGANRAYATLDAALLEWEGTTLTDVVEIICAASTGVADTTTASVTTKITTTTTNHILIRAATGHEALLTGFSTSRYRLNPAANNNALNAGSVLAHVIVRNLQIRVSSTGTANGIYCCQYLAPTDAGSFLRVENCRFEHAASGTGTGHRVIQFSGASRRLVVVNSLLIASDTNKGNVTAINSVNNVTNDSVLYNNTIIGAGVGVGYNGATGGTALKVVNCLTDDCADGFSTSTFRTGTDYNASSVASDAPGANSRNSQTFTFENAGSGDYRLAAGDAGARTFGANLSADSDYAFSTDMAGTARTAPWDIGAHESSSGGSGNAPRSMFYHLQGMR